MALIKCNECQKEISDKAEACPNCGTPINQRRITAPRPTVIVEQKKSHGVWIVVGILIVIVLVIIIIGTL